jgi:hypothetical protein
MCRDIGPSQEAALSQAFLALALFLSSAAEEAPKTAPPEPTRIELAKLYASTGRGARVAPEIEALRGRRVRVLGFMARMEDAPKGAFYLTRHPVEAEEGGAGTGDLPPGALRVEVPRLAGEEVAWIPGVVEAIGTLEVSRAEDREGRVSWLRVVVDGPRLPAAPERRASTSSGVDSRVTKKEVSP